jgi:hypothetical protein
MKKSFEQWMKDVDSAMDRICGLSSNDISDFCYRDAYDDGRKASSVAREALQADGF